MSGNQRGSCTALATKPFIFRAKTPGRCRTFFVRDLPPELRGKRPVRLPLLHQMPPLFQFAKKVVFGDARTHVPVSPGGAPFGMFLLPRCCERIIKVLMFRLASPTQGASHNVARACGRLPTALAQQVARPVAADGGALMGMMIQVAPLQRQASPHGQRSKVRPSGASRPRLRGSVRPSWCPVRRTRPCT